jgi:hypothetical protein
MGSVVVRYRKDQQMNEAQEPLIQNYESLVTTRTQAARERLARLITVGYLDENEDNPMAAKDFSWISGQWTIDNMDPADWIDAMFNED